MKKEIAMIVFAFTSIVLAIMVGLLGDKLTEASKILQAETQTSSVLKQEIEDLKKKYRPIIIQFTTEQTDKYEHYLELNMDDGTEWGGWLAKHVQECKQCRDSFLRNPAVGICEKAFDKFMEMCKRKRT